MSSESSDSDRGSGSGLVKRDKSSSDAGIFQLDDLDATSNTNRSGKHHRGDDDDDDHILQFNDNVAIDDDDENDIDHDLVAELDDAGRRRRSHNKHENDESDSFTSDAVSHATKRLASSPFNSNNDDNDTPSTPSHVASGGISSTSLGLGVLATSAGTHSRIRLSGSGKRNMLDLDAADMSAIGGGLSIPPHTSGFGSAPAVGGPFALNLGSPASRAVADELEEVAGSLPHTKQRRRTRNMEDLIELVPSLLAVSNFLKTHTCFEMVPNSGKVVVLEAQISLLDALSAMSENELFSATVWDAAKHDFIGLMSPIQLLLTVVHSRNELLPPLPAGYPEFDYDASNSLAQHLATAHKPHSSLSMFSSSAGDDDNANSVLVRAATAAATAEVSQPPPLADVGDVDLSASLRNCTVGRWLCDLSPLRVNAPTPAAPLPSAIGSPLLAKRAAKRGLCFIEPDDTLWDACRALLGALDSKLPLVDRETQSVLCIVTMSRLLSCLYNGLRPLPVLLTRSIDLLGVGSFINTVADRPRGHVSPRTMPSTIPPPSTRLSTPLGCALAIMAKHQAGSLVLVDDDYRPVTILAAADVPALFRIAVDVPPASNDENMTNVSAPPAPPAPAPAAPMAEDAPSLLSMSCGAAMERIAARCQRLLQCERSTSLADVMQMLVQNRVHQIVVVNERGVFDGVVSAADVLRFLCRTV